MDSLEVLKASVPFATITGVVLGALLNSRLGRKEKIRDHLFSYKIKSYALLAENIIETRGNLEIMRNSKYNSLKANEYNINDIYEKIKKQIAEQTLFLSDYIRRELNKLLNKIFSIVEIDIMINFNLADYNNSDIIQKFIEAIYECNIVIGKLQNELGLRKLDNMRR